MNDEHKTKVQLIEELAEARKQIAMIGGAHSGTKEETPDTAKGRPTATAPVLDPTNLEIRAKSDQFKELRVATHVQTQPAQSPVARRSPVPVAVALGLLVAATMIYTLVTGDRTSVRYAPLVDAAMEIKLQAALGHLWFEEVNSGDRQEDIAVVWEFLDRSAWYARAMLEGSENSEGVFVPLRDPVLRGEILEVLEKISDFRAIAEERLAAQDESGIGSKIDQRFDSVFEDFLRQADDVETSLQEAMAKNQRVFRVVQSLLISLCLALSVIVGIVFSRYERRRTLDTEALRESEAKYRRVSDNSPAALYQFMISPDGTWSIPYASDRLMDIFGIPPEDVMKDPLALLGLVHPEDQEMFREGLMESTGPLDTSPLTFRCLKDGEVIWVEARGMPTPLMDGGLLLDGLLLDITARKQAEDVLHESESTNRATFEQAAIGIGHVGLDGMWLRVNDRLCAIVGYTREELMNLTFQDITHRDDLDKDLANVQQMLAGEVDTYSMEKRYIRKDRSEVWINLTASLVKAASGDPQHFIAIVEDISERRKAQEFLRLKNHVFDASIAANSIADVNGNLTEINATFLRLWGYPDREEVIGRPLSDFLSNMDEATAIVTALGTVGVWEGEYTAKRGDGSTFIAHGLASVLHDMDGVLIGYQSAVEDVTARLHAEHEAGRDRAFLAAVLESITDGVVACDSGGVLTLFNQATREFHGLPEKPIPAEEWAEHYDLFLPDGETRMTMEDVPLFRALRGERVRDVEMVIVPENGELRRLLASGRVLSDANGKKIGAVVSMQDITERKQAEEEIHKLNSELEQRVLDRTAELQAVNQELEAFTYSVSHDLRAPLRHLTGYSELLQKNAGANLDEKARRHLTYISESAVRMGQLIDDLLAFSRAGRTELHKKPVDLDALVEEVINDLTPEPQAGRVVWQISPLPCVAADAVLLRAVLMNLFANALKFTRPRDEAKIQMGCTADERENTFFVRDNGVGFDMTYVAKLFGVFQRLHAMEDFEGTGVGLANVRRIIQRHGGRTWAESVLNEGATFYFTLPRPTEADNTEGKTT